MTEYFNSEQIEKMQEIVKEFHRLNNTFNSGTKIENIKIYKDDENNLYISYLGKYVGIEGPTVDDYYLKIDNKGKEERLNYNMSSLDLKNYFQTLKQVTL